MLIYFGMKVVLINYRLNKKNEKNKIKTISRQSNCPTS